MYDDMINAQAFYASRHGHPLEDLLLLHKAARERGDACMFLAGGSHFDNKHILATGDRWDPRAMYDRETTGTAAAQYASLMYPPRAVKDVAFWLCRMISDQGMKLTVLNAAVHDSTLADKKSGLNDHDQFIRDNLRHGDILAVSIGNDAILRPSLRAAVAMAGLLCSPATLMDAEWAPGLDYFRRSFKDDLEDYVRKIMTRVTATQSGPPVTVLVCTPFFPDETPTGGNAQRTLSLLGYNHFPRRLQSVIRKLHELGTTEIDIPGTRTIPVALFEALDGKNTNMYVHRVEPSVEGGRAIAKVLHEVCSAITSSSG
jgi:hypothetical protein